MARRLVAAMALAMVVGQTATGCGGSEKDGPELAWATKVCDAVGFGANGSNFQPVKYDLRDARKAKKEYLALLTAMNERLNMVNSKVQATGAPPVDDGKALLAKSTASTGATQTKVVDAILELRKARDRKMLRAAMVKVDLAMKAYAAYAGPVKDLRANADLNKAFDKSKACKTRKL